MDKVISEDELDECAGTTCCDERCCPVEQKIDSNDECEGDDFEDVTDILLEMDYKIDMLISIVKKLLPKSKALSKEEISFVGDSD